MTRIPILLLLALAMGLGGRQLVVDRAAVADFAFLAGAEQGSLSLGVARGERPYLLVGIVADQCRFSESLAAAAQRVLERPGEAGVLMIVAGEESFARALQEKLGPEAVVTRVQAIQDFAGYSTLSRRMSGWDGLVPTGSAVLLDRKRRIVSSFGREEVGAIPSAVSTLATARP